VPRTTRTALIALTALVVGLAGCSSDTAVPRPDAALPAVSPSTAGATASPTASKGATSPISSPRPTVSPKPRFTYDVAAVQQSLKDGKYYGGAVDGRSGSALRSAVMAFQKVNGIGADGSVGPATLAALKTPKKPVLKGASPSNRVEVDLTRQVLYVVRSGAVARILPISSGNGATYAQKDGSKAKALTPVGYYTVQRRILGERKADLGSLYDPQYFYKGWAIHGSNSVPARPASHGCVRVTRADAKYLLDAIGVGTAVYLYGGKHVFTAGSSAPGTDAPTGDTAGDTAPEPTATSTRAASPRPTRPAPSPTRQPTTAPTTAAPSPAASARPSATPGSR
jgi:lipoprotein-anchoring transpeptidase ErfK/SrfK